MQNYIGEEVDLLSPEAVLRALKILEQKIRVPVLIIHTRYWAIAYGADIEHYKVPLEAGVAMATTRLRCGDNFSSDDYSSTVNMPRERISTDFCTKIMGLSNRICCVASIAINQKNITTVGLGDAFVGGFLTKAAVREQ